MRTILMATLLAFSLSLEALAQQVTHAHFSDPSTQYQHGVFGENFEYQSIEAYDQKLSLNNAVFEDRLIRWVDLNRDGQQEILTIITRPSVGAALALVGLNQENTLAILAEGPPIGRSFRWQAPFLGQADFHRDAIDEVASILTPHINPRLQVLAWRGDKLQPLALPRKLTASNHAYGSMALDNSYICNSAQGPVMALTLAADNRSAWLVIDAQGNQRKASFSYSTSATEVGATKVGAAEVRAQMGCLEP